VAGVSRIRWAASWWGIAAILLVAAGAAACAGGSRHTQAAGVSSASGSGSPQQSPQVKTFSPYAATGTLAVPVADQTPGTCWTGSIAVPIAGAYRCIAGSQIYDPCFASPGASTVHSVACIADPWSKAHLVTVTGPLPKTTPAPDLRQFWALQLANGVRCVAVTGTVARIDGVDLDYVCGTTGNAAGIVVDDDQHLIAGYGPEAGPHLTRVPVQVAWRG
jgi:hypothetical protein